VLGVPAFGFNLPLPLGRNFFDNCHAFLHVSRSVVCVVVFEVEQPKHPSIDAVRHFVAAADAARHVATVHLTLILMTTEPAPQDSGPRGVTLPSWLKEAQPIRHVPRKAALVGFHPLVHQS
jgi:hypothetical protein